MSAFQIAEITRIRLSLRFHARMDNICAAFSANHVRGEVVEAIDAIRRHPDDIEACVYANRVLDMQASCQALINGRRYWDVVGGSTAVPIVDGRGLVPG